MMRAALLQTCRRSLCSSPPAGPLEGVKILDLTRVLAGPYATMILSDLGAEVIKVEKPGVGDDTRSWGPPFVEAPGGGARESAYFLSVNRNKQSMCVDLKSPRGRDLLHRLSDQADVLVENYVPGKLASMGLGYEDLRTSNPRLIYCSITGFGSSGPHSSRGGYDVVAASMGGLLNVTGDTNGPPAKVGVAMTDLATALYAHGAILAALYHRTATGQGQWLQCNLLATQVSTMTHLAGNWLNCGVESQRWGTAHMSLVPYQTFPTSGGHLTVGCGNNAQFADLCTRIGRPDLSEMVEFKNNEDRVSQRDTLIPLLTAALATKSNSEWSRLFEGAAFPYGPVNTMEEVFEDPQVQHLGLRQEVDHSSLGRPVSVVGPAVSFSGCSNRVRSGPPGLGEHTDQVLREKLGLDEDEIGKLRREGVVA